MSWSFFFFQLCFHRPRRYNEPCSAGFSCAPGLSCQPGDQRCFHHPRRENERCSAGYACADGLVCRLCDKPYATCQLSRVPALTDQVWDYLWRKQFSVTLLGPCHVSYRQKPFRLRKHNWPSSCQIQFLAFTPRSSHGLMPWTGIGSQTSADCLHLVPNFSRLRGSTSSPSFTLVLQRSSEKKEE